MRRTLIVCVIVTSAVVAACTSEAPNEPREAPKEARIMDGCDDRKASEAEDVAATPATWRELYGTFVLFRACDDGAIAEGFSEAVTVILAEKWALLPELSALASIDPAFEEFVLRHADASAAEENLEAIVNSSRDACPAQHTALCQRVEAHARMAVQEANLHLPSPRR